MLSAAEQAKTEKEQGELRELESHIISKQKRPELNSDAFRLLKKAIHEKVTVVSREREMPKT